MIKTLSLLTILIITTIQYSQAQDYNFSQFNLSRNYYNPAYTGINEGMLKTNLIYRNKWPKLPGNFSTKYFNLDYKNFNSSGMGLFAISDTQGESNLNTNTFGGSYSWNGLINAKKNIFYQFGISASYNIKSIDYNKMIFSDELDEIYGNIYSSSFVSDVSSINYLDFSVGALIHLPLIISNRKISLNTIGFALHHISSPKISFLDKDYRLPMKLTFHARSEFLTEVYSIDRRSKLSIIPTILLNIQDENIFENNAQNSLLCGVDVNTHPLFAGVWYRSQLYNNTKKTYESLIFKLGTHLYSKNKRFVYKLSYSYDIATANYSKTTRESHEIGLSINYLLPKACHNFIF